MICLTLSDPCTPIRHSHLEGEPAWVNSLLRYWHFSILKTYEVVVLISLDFIELNTLSQFDGSYKLKF